MYNIKIYIKLKLLYPNICLLTYVLNTIIQSNKYIILRFIQQENYLHINIASSYYLK